MKEIVSKNLKSFGEALQRLRPSAATKPRKLLAGKGIRQMPSVVGGNLPTEAR
jgi:hypothetical protein